MFYTSSQRLVFLPWCLTSQRSNIFFHLFSSCNINMVIINVFSHINYNSIIFPAFSLLLMISSYNGTKIKSQIISKYDHQSVLLTFDPSALACLKNFSHPVISPGMLHVEQMSRWFLQIS